MAAIDGQSSAFVTDYNNTARGKENLQPFYNQLVLTG
jgi:hypothetical protein